MFTDSTTVAFSAGKGGNGVVAWRREKYIPKGGPSGGNGGKGASVILETDSQVVSLEAFRNRRLIKADNGQAGGGALKQGRNGVDLILKIPCGTLVKNAKTKEVLFDFTEDKQRFVLCQGGRGGKGNACFKSPTHQAPNICTEGTEGESCEVELELKLIADVGLIGFPNAGKSTLLSQAAKIPVKIGAYPFTTLFPNLSYVQYEDYSRVLIADIPGIIENAHLDKGLGLAFLRHIERTKALIFVIDISGLEERDPFDDFNILRSELKSYDETLLNKPFLVVMNKTDLPESLSQMERFRKAYPFDPSTLISLSALEGNGLPLFKEKIRSLAKRLSLI